jgi:hypothetical protein
MSWPVGLRTDSGLSPEGFRYSGSLQKAGFVFLPLSENSKTIGAEVAL